MLCGTAHLHAAACEATLRAEAAARRAATLVYDAAEVMVEVVDEDQLASAFNMAGGAPQRCSACAAAACLGGVMMPVVLVVLLWTLSSCTNVSRRRADWRWCCLLACR